MNQTDDLDFGEFSEPVQPISNAPVSQITNVKPQSSFNLNQIDFFNESDQSGHGLLEDFSESTNLISDPPPENNSVNIKPQTSVNSDLLDLFDDFNSFQTASTNSHSIKQDGPKSNVFNLLD